MRATDRLTTQAGEHEVQLWDLARQRLATSPLVGELAAADLALLGRYADPNLLFATGVRRL